MLDILQEAAQAGCDKLQATTPNGLDLKSTTKDYGQCCSPISRNRLQQQRYSVRS